jgi:hypothetical protein
MSFDARLLWLSVAFGVALAIGTICGLITAAVMNNVGAGFAAGGAATVACGTMALAAIKFLYDK